MPRLHARRRAAVRADLRARGLHALVVTDLVDVRYLTGFTGSNAALLLHAFDEAAPMPDAAGERADSPDAGALLATDGRYRDQAAAQVPDVATLIERDCAAAVLTECYGAHAADAGRGERVGFEAEHMSVATHSRLAGVCSGLARTPELIGTTGIVEDARIVKDDGEIDAIAAACAAGDAALEELIAQGGVAPGLTERQVARRLEWLMFECGGEGIAFETIVAAGENSAIPHHRPTDRVLAAGDFVKLDFGSIVGGYNSDMTRTVVLGEPSEFQRDTYELVLAAQESGLAAARAGVDAATVDHAARSVIESAGLGARFTHGLGHGVGLEVHEAPAVSAKATGRLPAGAVITVEPGVYLPGIGGVRIEDTLVVQEDAPRVLTASRKDLRVL